jgi:hypothetical protein
MLTQDTGHLNEREPDLTREPKLRIYMATGVIGCKCETCGWGSKTDYVGGETAHQTARRVFGDHVCPPASVEGEPN